MVSLALFALPLVLGGLWHVVVNRSSELNYLGIDKEVSLIFLAVTILAFLATSRETYTLPLKGSAVGPGIRPRQLSHAVSDFFLSSCVWFGALRMYEQQSMPAAISLASIAIAASWGVFRFGVVPSVAPMHDFFVGLSKRIGVLGLGLHYTLLKGFWRYPDVVDIVFYIVVGIAVVQGLFTKQKAIEGLFNIVAPGVFVLPCVGYALLEVTRLSRATDSSFVMYHEPLFIGLGVIGMIISAGFVDPSVQLQKRIGGLYPVDLFHYGFGIALLSVLNGFTVAAAKQAVASFQS